MEHNDADCIAGHDVPGQACIIVPDSEWQPYGDQRSYPKSRAVSLIGETNAGYTIIDQRGEYSSRNDHDVVVLGWRAGTLAGGEHYRPGEYTRAQYVVWRVYFNGDGPLYSAGDYIQGQGSTARATEAFMKR